MIACASPVEYNLAETLNTLQYANRARNIKNRSEKNEVEEWMTTENIELLRSLIAKLKTEVRYLKTNRPKDEDQSISSHEDEDFERYHDQHLVVADLQRQVEELDGEATVTRERNRMVEKELQKLRLMLSKTDEKNKDADFQHLVEPVIEEYEKSISKLESQLAMTRAALNHTDSSYDDQSVKISQLETSVHNQERTISDLRLRLSKILEREQSNDTYIHDLETKLMKSANDATRDQEMLNELKSRIMKLKETDENTEQYIASLEQRLAAGEAERARLQESIEGLESKLELKERANMELYKKLSRTPTANDNTANTEKLILKELDQVTAKLSLAESERDRFKEKVDQLQKSADKPETAATPTAPVVEAREKKRPNSVSSNASSRSNRKSLAEENETATSAAALSIFQAEMRLKEESERANKLQLTLDMLKHDHEETVKELDEVLQRYQEALEQVDQLERDPNDADVLKSMDLNREMARAKEESYAREKDDYTQKIDELEKTILSLQTDLSQRPLMEDIELLEGSLEELKQEEDQYRQKAALDMMTIQELEHDLDIATKQISLLKESRNDKPAAQNGVHLDKEVASLKDTAELDALERKLQLKQAEIDQLSTDYTLLKVSHEELMKNAETVKLDKSALTAQQSKLDLDQAMHEYNSLRLAYEELDQKIKVKEEELTNIAGQLKEKQSELENAQHELTQQQQKINQFINDKSQLEYKANDIELRLQEKQLELNRIISEYTILKQAQQPLDQESGTQQEEQAMIILLKQQLSEKQTQFDAMKSEYEEITELLKNDTKNSRDIDFQKQQLEEKQIELDKALAEYTVLQQTHSSLKEEFEKLSIELEKKDELELQLQQKQTELNELKAEHDTLQLTHKNYQDDNEKQRSEHSIQVENQLLESQSKLEQAQQEFDNLHLAHQSLNEELKALQAKHVALESTNKGNQLDYEKQHSEYSTHAENKLQESQSKLNQAQQELDNLQLAHQSLNEELEEHQLQNQEQLIKQNQLETELDQMQQNQNALTSKHQELENTLEKYLQELEGRQATITSLERQKATLENDKGRLSADQEELERLLNDSQENADGLQKKLSDTLASLTVLKLTHDQLLKETANHNNAVAGQEAQRVQLAKIQEERDRFSAEINDLRSQLDISISKSKDLTQLLKEAVDEKNLLSADIGQLEEELNNVHRSHTNERAATDEVRKELDALEEENQELSEQIEMFKQDNDQLNQTLVETLDTHDATLKKLETLEASFMELGEEKDAAKNQYEVTIKHVKSLESALEEATAEKNKLAQAHQQKLDEIRAECEGLKQSQAKLSENDAKLHRKFELEKNDLSSQLEHDHKKKVGELLASHDNLSNQLQRQIDDLELELTSAKKALVEQSEELVSLEKSNSIKINQLKSDVDLLTQANREKEAQLDSNKHQIETMTRTIDSLEKVKASADFATQIQTTTDSDQLYKERIQSLEENLKKAEEENLEYASLSEELEKEVRRITQEMGAMSEELDASEETVIQYEGKLTEINHYVTQNKGSYDDLPMKVKELMEAAQSRSDILGNRTKDDQSSVNDIPSKVGGGPLPDPGADSKVRALEEDLRNCQIKLKEAADSQQAKDQAILDQKKEFTSLLAAEKQKAEKAERARQILEKQLDELLNKKKFMCF
jgi:chromosome segregation ATPase